MRVHAVLPLAVVAAGFAGCGADAAGDDRPARAAATPVPEATGTATPTPTAAPVSRRTAPARTSQSRARVEVLAGGLEVPWDVAFLPDGRALVTERPGRVRLLSTKGRVTATAARVPTQARGEGGLLGIAIDPGFADGRRLVYLYVTTASGVQVQRWRMTPDDRLRREAIVLRGIRAGDIHDSGRLRFGPDQRLYVATGDAGQRALAQRRSSLNGKILRLSPRQYRGRTSAPTIHALGLRNPQGLAWNRQGRLVATDHGPSGFDGPGGNDEINVIRAGGNYGWPIVQGPRHGRFRSPARLYRQAIAPSGATFVNRGGSRWTGSFLFGALKGQALHRLTFRGTRVVGEEVLYRSRYGRLRAVVEAPDGSLWVTTSNRDTYGSPVSARDDRILRVVPPAG
jgi:glucose/arabinose dehydrogenase